LCAPRKKLLRTCNYFSKCKTIKTSIYPLYFVID
jgi:hypothetical protein